MNNKQPNGGTEPCHLCGSENLKVFIDFGMMPIAHRFLDSRDSIEEKFPLEVLFCESCGLGQITDPIDPEILYREYNHCFTSWKPEPHRESEIDRLFQLGDVNSVMEIGSNDGLFLSLMKERGAETCVGVEPNDYANEIARSRGLTTYGDFISDELAEEIVSSHGLFDLVVSRQVLEHVSDITGFFRFAKTVLKPGGHVFIDVPDILPGLSRGDCSIIWEEHVNYFTESTLVEALGRNGFETIVSWKVNFSGGCLSVIGKSSELPSQSTSNVDPDTLELLRGFESAVKEYGSKLKSLLEKVHAGGKSVIVYGSGCRACTILNGHHLGDLVDRSVDDQKERQGKFIPGARIEIVSPEVGLQGVAGGLILLAVNQESEERVRERIGSLDTDSVWLTMSLHSPNDLLEEIHSVEALV